MKNTLIVMRLSRRDDIPEHIKHTFRMDEPQYRENFRVVRGGNDIPFKWTDQVVVLADDTQLISGYIVSVMEQLAYWMPGVPMLVLPVEDAPPPRSDVDKYIQATGYWGQP